MSVPPARPDGPLRRARPLLLSNAIDAGSRHASDLATDVIAVAALGATATQMGLLNALGTTAFLVLGVPVGVLVDRSPTARTLLGSGLARAALLATLLLAWWLDGLTLAHLYAVALLAGVCSVVTETVQTAITPRLGGPQLVGTVVARMQSAETVLGLVAPAAAGALAAALGAGPLLAIAVAATVLSAVVVLFLRTDPLVATHARATEDTTTSPARAGGALARLFAEAREGWTTLLRRPELFRVTLAVMLINLGLAVWSAIEVLVILRTLELGTEVLGLIVSAGALGGLVGSLVAVPLGSRVGSANLMRASMLALVPTAALVAVAVQVPARATAILLVHAALWGLFMVAYNVQLAGLVAEWTPTHLLGRVAATRRTLTMGVVPLGGILGGVVADCVGISSTLLLWCLLNAVGAALAVLAISAQARPNTASVAD
jgi:MFS family permease